MGFSEDWLANIFCFNGGKLCKLCSEPVHDGNCLTVVQSANPRDLAKITAYAEDALQKVELFLPQVDALECKSMQAKVHAALFLCILASPSERERSFEVARKLTATYQHKDKVLLLHLSVWKALCIMNCPEHMTNYLAWSKWGRNGWKGQKEQMRNSAKFVVIIKNVLPFLGDAQSCRITSACAAGVHRGGQSRAKNELSKSIQEVTKFLPKVNQLESMEHRERVHSKLFWFTLKDPSHPAYDCMREAKSLTDKFQHRDRVSLLELMSWKVVCIMQCPNKDITDYLAWLDWSRHGWKQEKAAMRHSNVVHVIVSSVLPFLTIV